MNTEGTRFIKFVVTGGAAACVNVGLRWALNMVTPFEIAVAVAYFFAMTLAFGLSKAFVFEPSGLPVRTEFARFSTVNVISLAIVWAVSVSLYRFVFPATGMIWHPDTVAHMVGVISPVFAAYFMHKHFSFRMGRQ